MIYYVSMSSNAVVFAGKNEVLLTDGIRGEMDSAATATAQTIGAIRANKTGTA